MSIKYVKPVYAKTANGKDLNDKVNDADSIYNNERNNYDEDGTGYRKAIYEVTEDRINQELATAPKVGATGKNFTSKTTGEGDEAVTTVTFTFAEKDGKWGENGEKLLKGYTVVYYGTNENDVVAIETSRAVNGNTAFAVVDTDTVDKVEWGKTEDDNHVLTVTLNKGKTLPEGKELNCFARFDSENDFDGDYLGEVEIKMYDYQFEPRPTSIGVSWSQLSEIELDTSFNLSAEEYLVTYAAQAIKVALDYKAIRLAYQQAKLNKKYHVTFDAAYATNVVKVDEDGQKVEVDNAGTKDGYVANAQTIGLAIETVGDNMLNDIDLISVLVW